MICDWCRHAADFASGRDRTPIEEGQGLAYAYDMAAKMHSRCTGCNCQHRPLTITPNLPEQPTPESLARLQMMGWS
jgi:hypothetical protein